MTSERAAEICQYIKFMLKNEDYTEEVEEALDMAIEALEQEPTCRNFRQIDLKRGKWIPIIEGNEFGEPYQSGIYCSECGETLGCEANFCPNCGADMRGDEEA